MNGKRLTDIVMVVMFLGLIVITGLLIKQNRDLKAELAAVHAGEEVPQLHAGDVVDAIELAGLDGSRSVVDYQGPEETLLLFFSPDCPACGQNFGNWQTIDAAGLPDRRIVYVSTHNAERTREYVQERGLDGAVLLAGRDVLDRYKVARIPTTVRVDRGGVVSGSWVGVLSSDVVAGLAATR